MKRFTLIQALQHINKVFTDVISIRFEDNTGLNFVIKTDFLFNQYHISLSDTGIVNSIIKLES